MPRTKTKKSPPSKASRQRGSRLSEAVKKSSSNFRSEIHIPKSGKIIRDPLHDLIRVEKEALALIETNTFQRLRKIRQLGLAYLVYPGAEHSRFTHSLGAYHLARRVVRSLSDIDSELFSEEEKRAIPLAALCHDIGHGPFSHMFEKTTKLFLSKEEEVDHEYYTRLIIREDPHIAGVLKKIGGKIPDIVFDVIAKAYKPKYANDIVSSQMDVDRFDYLMRDSLMTGVKYGDLDLNWILRTLLVGESSKKDTESQKKKLKSKNSSLKVLALDGRRGLGSVESYILGRHFMYKHVYYHKTIQAAESMLKKLLFLVVNKSSYKTFKDTHPLFRSLAKKKVPTLSDYLSLHDFAIFDMMERWAKANYGHITDLSRRLLSRNIFSCIVMPDGLSHTDRLEKDSQTREILKKNGFDPKVYLIFQAPSDRAFEDLYFHIQAGGKQSKHQEINYIDASGNVQSLSTAGSFVSELSFQEERLYVPKEVIEPVQKVWLD